MSTLTISLGVLLMFVVAFMSVAELSIACEQEHHCCHNEPGKKGTSQCSPTQEQGCSSEGNPFHFCSCCAHVWEPFLSINIIGKPCTAIVAFLHDGNQILPSKLSYDFWQPPRFS